MKTTVACVLVKGHVPYTVEYVQRLRSMVARWMDRPFRFVCLTDRPGTLPPDVEPIEIPSPRPLWGWWSKIRLFDPSLGLTGRVLYLDLDTLIVGPLAQVLSYPAPFALVPHAGSFEGRNGLAVVKRFNSSVMTWDAGAHAHLFEQWNASVAKRLHGDQDWIGEQATDAEAMPAEWFPRLSELQQCPDLVFPPSAVVVLAKKPKPIEAARRWPAFREAWA